MRGDFIKMINDIDFLYGFIYECANLINNLYIYDNYDHLVIKLCSESVMPIINITKKEHIKEYNRHVLLKHNKDIFNICSYLMNICCERYFKLSHDQYLKIKKFIDNNIDIAESAFAPMIDYFDLYKKCYSHYYCSCYDYHKKKVIDIFSGDKCREFHEKIIKLYFNIEYIKFFYLLQKETKLNKNIRNINVLIDIFMNLYDNSNIDYNKKNKNKLYDLYNNILLNKFVQSNKYKNNFMFNNYIRPIICSLCERGG